MPYIDPLSRSTIDDIVRQLSAYNVDKALKPVDNCCELNYAISTLVDQYITNRCGLKYGAINEVIGVLECAKLELYRRIAAPYEDGDVYQCDK
jgi:hypothetical protein